MKGTDILRRSLRDSHPVINLHGSSVTMHNANQDGGLRCELGTTYITGLEDPD